MKDFESLRIERADNGFTLSVHYPSKPSKDTKKGYISGYVEPDKTVHESAESVLGEVKKLLSGGKPMSKKKSGMMNQISSAMADKY